MNAKEAYDILRTEFDDMDVIKCMEYDSQFVFQLVPYNRNTDDDNRMFGGLVGVIKATKEVRDFKPFNIPRTEYKAGKQIINYKD